MNRYPLSQVPGATGEIRPLELSETEGCGCETIRNHQDFGSALERHLELPLAGARPSGNGEAAQSGMVYTIGYWLLATRPPPDALRRVKEFAKTLRARTRSDQLKQVATVIYFASLAAAELRANAVITTLPRAAIRAGYRWAWGRAWTYLPLCYLFEAALAMQDHCATRSM